MPDPRAHLAWGSDPRTAVRSLARTPALGAQEAAPPKGAEGGADRETRFCGLRAIPERTWYPARRLDARRRRDPSAVRAAEGSLLKRHRCDPERRGS